MERGTLRVTQLAQEHNATAPSQAMGNWDHCLDLPFSMYGWSPYLSFGEDPLLSQSLSSLRNINKRQTKPNQTKMSLEKLNHHDSPHGFENLCALRCNLVYFLAADIVILLEDTLILKQEFIDNFLIARWSFFGSSYLNHSCIMLFILLILVTLCCSRKYLYPSHRRFFKLNSPLRKLHFSVTL